MTLTELFNPSFFMILGILLLALSFLIFYFENKMREQNHKINSMFSLVSSITEELNNANMRIHYMMNGSEGSGPVPTSNSNIHSVKIPSDTFTNEKIEVSDDDSEGDDDDTEGEDDDTDGEGDTEGADTEGEDEGADDDTDGEDTDADADTDADDSEGDDDKTYYQGKSSKTKPVPVVPTLEELSDLDEDDSMNGLEEEEDRNENKNDKKQTKVLLMESELPPLEESTFSSDLKSIHISLDQPNDSVDPKKLSVTQLRNLVLQKGLAGLEEATKMKKGDLHKLLSSNFL